MHGFGIAQRIQQISENVLRLNQGTLYPALLRLEQRGCITIKWTFHGSNLSEQDFGGGSPLPPHPTFVGFATSKAGDVI